jgi:hypothetical protein
LKSRSDKRLVGDYYVREDIEQCSKLWPTNCLLNESQRLERDRDRRSPEGPASQLKARNDEEKI